MCGRHVSVTRLAELTEQYKATGASDSILASESMEPGTSR